MTVIFTFSIPKDKSDKNYEKIIMNSNVNICKLMTGVVGDFLSKMIMEDLQRAANFVLKCPITIVIINFYVRSLNFS